MLNLNFLGIGSAFQTQLYNNTAYFIEGDTLYLLDCGETAFAQLEQQPFFANIKHIYVAFTHTHSDHIGGLGQLVEYCDKKLDDKLNVVVPNLEDNSLYTDIKDLLTIFSLDPDKCNFMGPEKVENRWESFDKMLFLPTFHAPGLEDKCYSLMFNTKVGKVLYTGDTTDTKYIKKLVEQGDYDKIYVDTTLSLPTVHLDLNVLNEIVPPVQKKKIYCMHFDSYTCMEKAQEFGFNIAPSVARDLSQSTPKFRYLKLDDKLLLSNCSETTFMHLYQKNILANINDILLPLENTNHEQVASLGSLLSYCYFILKRPLHILTDSNVVKEKMTKLIELYGVPPESISFSKPLDENTFPDEVEENSNQRFFRV